jgi:beta-mannanase
VDPNEDYDGYCGYVKLNDNRKAMTTFMCYLTKYNVLDSDTLLSITDYIIELLPVVAERDNATSVVDEYSDNLYILITTAYDLFINSDRFNTITIEKLTDISRFRKIDRGRYKSMSSRASFKILDLLDYIKKH